MFGKRRTLGLAVTDRSAAVVEVAPSDGGGRARRAAEFVFPEGAALSEPAALGKALRQFLRTKGFTASRCMIGLQAGWVMAGVRTLPPGADESIPQILSLAIEREFASDGAELVFDYALGADGSAERSALLVGAPQRILNQLATMAQAAGLAVAGVTVSSLALADSTEGSTAAERLVLHLFDGGAELVLHAGDGPRLIRHLPVSFPAGQPAGTAATDGWLTDLGNQLWRIVAMLPDARGSANTRRELILCDEIGLDSDACKTLSDRLALPVRNRTETSGVDATRGAGPSAAAPLSAAAALAMNALAGRRPAVDLLHSRLTPRKTFAIDRKLLWAALAAVAVIVAGGALVLDWRSDSFEAASLQTQLTAMAADVTEAKAAIARVSFARWWYERQPGYLDCMRELTLAFPEEGVIWTTSLAIQEDPAGPKDMRAVFSGKAVSESAVLDVLDRLKANTALHDVKPRNIHRVGRSGREVAFSMSFAFKRSDTKWSSRNAKN